MISTIKQRMTNLAEKAGDGVAKLSSLSPAQVVEIDELRDDYLLGMPEIEDRFATELTSRLLAAAGIEIYDAFLPQLKNLYIPIRESSVYGEAFQRNHNIRLINITKWVIDSDESSLDKLVNVYGVLASELCNIGLIFHRKCTGTEVFLAVVNTKNAVSNIDVRDFRDRIESSLKGNFPGSEFSRCTTENVLNHIFGKNTSVAAISGVPTEKSVEFRSQTIEKMLDGIVPDSKEKEYALILLATPALDAEERKMRLEQLYTGLAPYSSWQTSFTYTEHQARMASATVGLNAGVSIGRQVGENKSLADGSSASESASESEQETEGVSRTDSVSDTLTNTVSHSAGVTEGESIGVSAGGGVQIGGSSSPIGGNLDVHVSKDWQHSTHIEDGTSTAKATTKGEAIAKSTSRAIANTIGKAVTKSVTRTVGSFASQSLGANFGANFARTSTVSTTIGKNEGIQQSHVNYTIKHALTILERQVKRLEEGMSLGLWGFGAYVVSNDSNITNNVAHMYLSLLQGKESFVTQSAVNSWRGDIENNESARVICSYLRDLRHPVFALNPDVVKDYLNTLPYPTAATATTTLTGKELARALNFPRKPIAGFPVLECASFGRNVCTFDGSQATERVLGVGSIFHMQRKEDTKVVLDLDSLAGHTFVTGSTGSGKSNVIYRILELASKQRDIGFLVVEPAKGEYKGVFGNDPGVKVFGTNPAYTPLLRLNPFSFPNGVHVLEHLDRLVEIFCACWPMYAAMPAVLKRAIESAYEDCGWDLTASTNEYSDGFYPSFADVARNVQQILDKSDYDAESRGAYKGALLMRLGSLTSGINGQVFCDSELSCEELFEGKTVVDLSRVGSTETKSLIMGILVLKLQEWRSVNAMVSNAHLRHITVLEEAHHLLRRTSFEQNAEGSNLQGKSVEMLTNAIAEMRTYGEGFIIADQAPGLLDPSAIRNTNTKIVFRLPDASDRMLAGGSEALTERQIVELARLPRGVAAVYQNDWVEAVLCKFDKAEHEYSFFSQPEAIASTGRVDPKTALNIIRFLSIGGVAVDELDVAKVKACIVNSGMPCSLRVSALRILENPPMEPSMERLAPIISSLLPDVRKAIAVEKERSSDPVAYAEAVQLELERLDAGLPDYLRRVITHGVFVDYLIGEMHDQNTYNEWKARGVF